MLTGGAMMKGAALCGQIMQYPANTLLSAQSHEMSKYCDEIIRHNGSVCGCGGTNCYGVWGPAMGTQVSEGFCQSFGHAKLSPLYFVGENCENAGHRVGLPTAQDKS